MHCITKAKLFRIPNIVIMHSENAIQGLPFFQKCFFEYLKKRPLETFQIFLHMFGTNSQITRMSSDPLTHSKNLFFVRDQCEWGCKVFPYFAF